MHESIATPKSGEFLSLHDKRKVEENTYMELFWKTILISQLHGEIHITIDHFYDSDHMKIFD